MLGKIGNLKDMFGQKEQHPLADGRELRRILAELPTNSPFKALDEVVGWLESVKIAQDFPGERLFDTVRQLDEATQAHLRRLAKDYLHTQRLSRSDEKRLWAICHGCWELLAELYERCLLLAGEKGKPADQMKAALPLLCARLIVALGGILRWEQFHYGPSPGTLWQRLGGAMLAAEVAGVATKALTLYPQQQGVSSPQQEYLKVLAFQAASMDSLLPLEIDLAERFIVHFLPGFVFGKDATHDSVYWVDLALPQPPQRLARMPAGVTPTQRFFKPVAAHQQIQELLKRLELGGEVPSEINLGGQFSPKLLIPVLRHLAAYLAPVPPQRSHARHRVKHRMSVLNGLINAFVVFSGEFGGRPAGLQMESWVVDNVSRGGFGALLNTIPAEWLKVGALIAMQPEGGENWLLGIIRRYRRDSELEARVGIQTLAMQVVSVELKPRTASSYAAAAGIPGLLIRDGNAEGEVRVVLPPISFDLRESLEYIQDGRTFLLSPVALAEQTADYEVARYRLRVVD